MHLIELEDKRDYLAWREGSGYPLTVELYNISVGSERRKGKGRKLVNLLLGSIPKETKLVFAITRATNFIAQRFYEEMRFRVVAVLRHFYQDGPEQTVDAIMYGRDIGSQA